jgi:hypothetical protein
MRQWQRAIVPLREASNFAYETIKADIGELTSSSRQ